MPPITKLFGFALALSFLSLAACSAGLPVSGREGAAGMPFL